MLNESINSRNSVVGVMSAFTVDDRDIWTPRGRVKNDILYDWGFIAAKAIGQGDRDYRIRTMYIEFENVAAPGDPVAVPTIAREDGIEYYNSMVSSATRDFLRIALRFLPGISIATGFENFFTDGIDGNQLSFLAQTVGTVGFHGKTFSESVNSKIYGAALVASPDFSDQTQDVVFNRGYLDVSNQVLKEASSQVGISWDVTFK